MDFFNESKFGLLCIFERILVRSVLNRRFFRNSGFLSSLGHYGHTSQHPNYLVGSKRSNIGRETSLLSSLISKDVSYNGDSHEALNWVHDKYALPQCAP